jgi:MFS family permease
MNRRNPEKGVLKLTLLLASTLTVMAWTMIAPALPSIQAHFAEVANVAFWVRLVLTLPALFIAASAPIVGYIVDRIGRKTVLVIATLLYGISGIAGYLAPTLTLLLISRASLGIAVGALTTSVTTLIADYYTGATRGRFMGLQAGFMGLAGTVYLALGGVLADIGWRVPFLTYSLAFVILPLILLALYEPLLGEQCAEKPHLASDPGECVAESIRATQSINSVGAVASPAPIRFLLFMYLVMIGSQIVFYLIPVQLPFYLQDVTGASASQSGLAISVMTLFYALASLQYGRLASRLHHLQVLTIAFALLGVGYLLIWWAGGWAIIVLGLLLGGIGMGLLIPNVSVWLADETPLQLRGRVLGGLMTALFLGQFLSPIVGQPVSGIVGSGGLYLSAGVLLLVIAALFWVTRNQLRSLTG